MKTLCLVDDDDLYKLIFRKNLELYGIPNPLLEFSDGLEALEHFKTTDEAHSIPEVILLDLNMYDMDGWDFLTAFNDVRERLAKKVDVYILSNSLLKKDLERAKEIPNVKGYLLKPISFSKLKTILQ